MVQVKLIKDKDVIYDLSVGEGVLKSTLNKLGEYVMKEYDVKSTESQVPSDKNNREGYFKFICTEGEVKITTSMC